MRITSGMVIQGPRKCKRDLGDFERPEQGGGISLFRILSVSIFAQGLCELESTCVFSVVLAVLLVVLRLKFSDARLLVTLGVVVPLFLFGSVAVLS